MSPTADTVAGNVTVITSGSITKKVMIAAALALGLASISSAAHARPRRVVAGTTHAANAPAANASANANANANATPVDQSNAPFRAKLLSNAALTKRAAATLNAIAKMPVTTSTKLSSAERKLFADQTKWLADSSSRLTVLGSQMDVVLAKGSRAPATELAQMNLQLLTLREALESESRRFGDLAPARARHNAALSAIRAEK